MASGCMLLTMKTICRNTCCNEKRPEPIQEMSGTMFFKAQSNFVFGISKKKFIHQFRYPQNDHQKIFFLKKNLSKKIANKFLRENLSTQNGVGLHATDYEI